MEKVKNDEWPDSFPFSFSCSHSICRSLPTAAESDFRPREYEHIKTASDDRIPNIQWAPIDPCCSRLNFDFIIQSSEGDLYHLEWCSFYDKKNRKFLDYFIYKSKAERCSEGFREQLENTPPIFETSRFVDFTVANPYCVYDIPQPK